jgi:hypothetical protein
VSVGDNLFPSGVHAFFSQIHAPFFFDKDMIGFNVTAATQDAEEKIS